MTDSSEEDSAPEVSPDGRYIVFGSLRGGGNQVWRMDMDGANQKQLNARDRRRPHILNFTGWSVGDLQLFRGRDSQSVH